MTNQLLIKLTNKFIDKELTKEEEQQLILLLKNTNNKTYFESFTRTINEIEENKPREQQINIRENIMSKIQNKKDKNSYTNFRTWLLQIFAGSKISYALSFALGGLITTFIFMLQSANTEISDEFMKGVISSRSFDESYFLDEALFSGAIKVSHSEGIMILDVDLTSAEVIECELKYDKNQFAFYGVKSVKSTDGGKIISGGSSIRLSNIDSNHYLVFLRNLKNNPSKIQASFYQGSITLTSLSIDIKN